MPPSSIPGCTGDYQGFLEFALQGATTFNETLSIQVKEQIVSATDAFLQANISFPPNSYVYGDLQDPESQPPTLEANGSILIAGLLASVSQECGADSPPIDPFFENALESAAFLEVLLPILAGTSAAGTESISLVTTPFPNGVGR